MMYRNGHERVTVMGQFDEEVVQYIYANRKKEDLSYGSWFYNRVRNDDKKESTDQCNNDVERIFYLIII